MLTPSTPSSPAAPVGALDIVSSAGGDLLGDRQLQDAASGPTAVSALSPAGIALSLFLFLFAGVLEIGGGYLVWRGVREKWRPEWTIPLGCVVLCAYGFAPCAQPLDSFGRIYAVYGGFFIVLSYLWGYVFDGMRPDVGDYVGSAIALAGVCVAWFWPR
jgi:drug/metabolite transporter superfamily protein YnfA